MRPMGGTLVKTEAKKPRTEIVAASSGLPTLEPATWWLAVTPLAFEPANLDQVQIRWPLLMPTPSDDGEQRAIRTMFPGVDFSGSKRYLRSAMDAHQPRWSDMSAWEQSQLVSDCNRMNFNIRQAIGLRTTVYRSVHPWKFEGNEQETKLNADAFEDEVRCLLSARGVVFETEEQQLAVFRDTGLRGPTPDFLIRTTLTINHQEADIILNFECENPIEFEKLMASNNHGGVFL